MIVHPCIQCGVEMIGSHSHRKFCSGRCKAAWWRAHPHSEKVSEHTCRQCGSSFSIGAGQNNKWLCSDECRRAAMAQSVREFHLRRPMAAKIHRAKSREKNAPDSMNVRFYRLNPAAPRCCESCGEARVTEIAHRPGHERLGQRRSSSNMKWPEMVWVLCPTCHRLLDRMNYTPAELGLK